MNISIVWQTLLYTTYKENPFYIIGKTLLTISASIFIPKVLLTYFVAENMKQELEDEARRIMSEADSLINLSQPRLTKEEVVLCTEQITKRIQELLLAAQAGKHSR